MISQNCAHKFICKLHKFATCNWNFEKSGLSDMHYPLTDIQADFEINRPVRKRITAKRNYTHRRQTDRQMDRQTDRRTDGRTDVAHDNNRYFFRKKKKLLKIVSRINMQLCNSNSKKSLFSDIHVHYPNADISCNFIDLH